MSLGQGRHSLTVCNHGVNVACGKPSVSAPTRRRRVCSCAGWPALPVCGMTALTLLRGNGRAIREALDGITRSEVMAKN